MPARRFINIIVEADPYSVVTSENSYTKGLGKGQGQC
jgi:hypothetical protein